MKIIVASLNKQKISAVEEVIKEYSILSECDAILTLENTIYYCEKYILSCINQKLGFNFSETITYRYFESIKETNERAQVVS